MLTALIGIVVTGLCSYAFYQFRTGAHREQHLADALKVVQASSEIVSSIAERGMPSIRNRLEELESREKLLEQHQRKTNATLERLALSSGPSAGAPAPPVDTTSESAIMAARRAARGQ
jgi:hypothetical protein